MAFQREINKVASSIDVGTSKISSNVSSGDTESKEDNKAEKKPEVKNDVKAPQTEGQQPEASASKDNGKQVLLTIPKKEEVKRPAPNKSQEAAKRAKQSVAEAIQAKYDNEQQARKRVGGFQDVKANK